jgi:hypothetical protein
MTRLLDYLGYNDLPATMYEEAHGVESCSCGFVRPENAIRKFFFWAFRSSFSAVFVASIAGFFILTNIFAIGIYSIWHRHPTCVGGSEINPGWYIDAFGTSLHCESSAMIHCRCCWLIPCTFCLVNRTFMDDIHNGWIRCDLRRYISR